MKIGFLLIIACVLVYRLDAKTAYCILRPEPGSTVKGNVTFTQEDSSSPTVIEAVIEGLSPKAKQGFHVHQTANFTNGCVSAGPHFNPTNKPHGDPRSEERHAGDMGNLVADSKGVAYYKEVDPYMTMFGANSIIGRSCMVHQDEDDLGKGGHNDSKTTGHAGARLACAEIIEGTLESNGSAGFLWKFSLLIVIGGAFYYFCVHRTEKRYAVLED